MDLDTLQTFLGWCLVINYGILVIWWLIYMGARNWVVGLHARMFHIDETVVSAAHFNLMGLFKMLVFVFVLTPWLALIIMGD